MKQLETCRVIKLRATAAQIPGLNAPIPPGAQFGYQAGGWGKPPVTEDGIPLYGDVFGERLADDDDEAVPSPPAPAIATTSCWLGPPCAICPNHCRLRAYREFMAA